MADGRTTTAWYVVIDIGRDRNGKRCQKWHGGFRTRKEAEAARAKIVADLNGGSYVAPTGTTLEQWVRDTWLPVTKSRVKPSTWDSYRRNLELHVLPVLGQRPLQQIKPAMLDRLYADLLERGNHREKGGLSAKTVRYIHTTVRKALGDAVDAELIARNPAERAKPPRPRASTTKDLRFWEPDELARFLNHVAGSRLAALWRLLGMTGMRRGEVLGLRWSDIDFDNARLSVRHTIISVGYVVQESTPKTHQARVIDLDQSTLDRLRSHRTLQDADRNEWADDYGDGDLVFAREDGSPVHPDSITQLFEREIARAELKKIPSPRSPAHARHHRPSCRRTGQGHQRTPRPREPGVHAEAVRPRHPRNAGRGRSADRHRGKRRSWARPRD
ncbi:MAG: site-specific integrase [Acidimicrobiia bacterium]|nr:site-specific integrase [Acidimicrobiia bacterium]